MTWRAEFSDASERQLKRLPRSMQERVSRALDELSSRKTRFGVTCCPLKGQLRGRYRKRVGRYRIIFVPIMKSGWLRYRPSCLGMIGRIGKCPTPYCCRSCRGRDARMGQKKTAGFWQKRGCVGAPMPGGIL